MDNDFPEVIFGLSPAGGNAVEGTSDADAEVRDTTKRGIPLVYYAPLNSYISEQRMLELESEEESLETAQEHRDEEEFLTKAGFKRNI